VVITVVAVPMMQASVHQVVHMVAMGNHLMPTTFVSTQTGNRLAGIGIGGTHFNNVFIVMIFVGVVQMSIVQKIRMSVVLNSGVSTMLIVDMCVVRVYVVAHRFFLSRGFQIPSSYTP
jgi:hypothetical protein